VPPCSAATQNVAFGLRQTADYGPLGGPRLRARVLSFNRVSTVQVASVSLGKIFLDLQALAFNGFYTNSGIQKSIRRDT